jgi:hypothetical protein
MRTRTLFAALLIVVGLVVGAGRAEARPSHVHFLGAHPIAAKYGGGYCYIETPHIHAYAPDHLALYQQVGDQYVFTGDPTPFGYDGDKHPFYGHHPVVTVGADPVYCYINGPHFHAFAAPEIPDYQVRDGVAFYVGAFPPAYVKVNHERTRVVNAEYRPYVSYRPTVVVTPPPEWHGEVWVAPPAVAVQAPGVYVSSPGVVVAAPPPPHVEVQVSAPGVYVAPPSAGVYVGAPGVVVGAPGPVVVGGPRRVIVEDDNDQGGRWHHDNGRHEGWYKDRREERGEWKHEEHEERKEWKHDNGKHNGWGHK